MSCHLTFNSIHCNMNQRQEQQTIPMDGTQTNVSKWVSTISKSKQEDSTEETVPIRNMGVWNEKWYLENNVKILFNSLIDIYRLGFEQIPILEDMKIDNHSSLKWCPHFLAKEESDALFDHLIEGISIDIQRKKASV